MKRNFAYLLLLPLLLVGCADNNSAADGQGSNNQTSINLPNNVKTYYASVDTTKTGQALRDSIHAVISKGKSDPGYGGLYGVYAIADVDEHGKIVDMYTKERQYTPNDHGGTYPEEGDGFNREHTIPKSWWGGAEHDQGSDPFIVYPTDGAVNRMRSNYPYGEVKNVSNSSKNSYCKLGSSKLPGYNATVFEPNDEWKGDIARIYFYAATCYDAQNWSKSQGRSTFTKNGTVGLTDYARKLFMKWHLQDPVSEWELKRNSKVQTETHNRNPFIDHPEWATQIWGSETY